jgi:UrcA family protein
MYAKTALTSARSILAAAIASSLLAGNVAAGDHTVDVALHVSAQGLNMSRPADARTFYTRLENAAWVACTRGNRVDLVPSDNPKACSEKALAGAVRSAKIPAITQIYLATHTPQEAAAHGIDAPVQMASK